MMGKAKAEYHGGHYGGYSGGSWGPATPKRVVTLPGGLEVWAGPWAQRPKNIDYFLSRVGEAPEPLVRTFGVPVALKYRGPKGVAVDWPDMDAPEFLPREFWEELANWLAGQRGKFYVGCTAGKGRTGTALAILAYFWGLEKERPIAWVRANYNSGAVETASQVEYIRAITGTQEDAQPSNQAYFRM